MQVLTGHCNLQRYKKTAGRAESSLCPKCCLEDETPNHHVGNCKLYQDIRVKYFGITKTTVHNVVTKCNPSKHAYVGPILFACCFILSVSMLSSQYRNNIGPILQNTYTGLPQKLQNQIPGLSRTFLGHFPGLFQDCLNFFCCT